MKNHLFNWEIFHTEDKKMNENEQVIDPLSNILL